MAPRERDANRNRSARNIEPPERNVERSLAEEQWSSEGVKSRK